MRDSLQEHWIALQAPEVRRRKPVKELLPREGSGKGRQRTVWDSPGKSHFKSPFNIPVRLELIE